ncbi:MAG TPA: iron-containing redox enzyme family protein [Conexibacter sp.]|nr:iron-containing redox enzyme family protein [Conexibacter sp.]
MSGILLEVLRCAPGMPVELPLLDPSPELLADDDVQLALYLCYELHYGEFAGVDDRWEWDPGLLAFRAVLERAFEASLCEAVPPPQSATPAEVVGTALHALVAADERPSPSRFAELHATRAQMRELMIHRSAYHLKEADPHAWAIPRLSDAPKAALAEVQMDGYGGGHAERVHATLFARSMAAAGLDPRYGAYVERLPGITLATVNVMSLCGLHRRLRGAIVGHLAVLEMASPLPNRRYGDGLRRLGFGEDATAFFDKHVEADVAHEQVATWDLSSHLAAAEPELASDILWGAAVLLELEARWSRHLLDAWERGVSSLLAPRSREPLAGRHRAF